MPSWSSCDGRWGNGIEILLSRWRIAFRHNPQRGALHTLGQRPLNPYGLICEWVDQLDLSQPDGVGTPALRAWLRY